MRSPPEDEEFRCAVADVSPLRNSRRAFLRAPSAQPVARRKIRDERQALEASLSAPVSVDDALDTGGELSYLRAGLPRQVLRKLRRAHWVIEDNLDLHGMNRVQAAVAVSEYLKRCRLRGARCVRIVHGKGLGSPNREPVLRGLLRKWLAARAEVLAYCQAPPAHGGSGAALVLLSASG